ncbi:MAG: DUF2516 domain-containing protein [Acidimicrobiales bacterium]|nr:MAG: DUF2516 domain-containing protein [Acidimicrobiales bacterium]
MSLSDTSYWGLSVAGLLDLAIFLGCFVVVIWALVHCARQRADAFTAVDTLSKPTWLLIIAGSALLSLLFFQWSRLFGLIALTAGLIYLLDVRPAIRDAIRGNW